MNAASAGERAAQLSEQLFAYVRSAGFLCSDSGVVRLADRRIGVRVRIYARHNGECVLVQGRNRRVFVRRSAHGSMIRSTYPSARLQLLAALFLEETARIAQIQATLPCPRCGRILEEAEQVHYITTTQPAYSPLLGRHTIETRRECKDREPRPILPDPLFGSEGEVFRDRVRIGVRALLEQKSIEPDKIDELQEAIVDVAEKARLGANVQA